MEHFV